MFLVPSQGRKEVRIWWILRQLWGPSGILFRIFFVKSGELFDSFFGDPFRRGSEPPFHRFRSHFTVHLETFPRLFRSCCKPSKMQPLQCESSVLEVLGVQIFMIVCSILQGELQDRLLTSFLEVLVTFVAPFWEPPGINFDFVDSFFDIVF